MTRAAIYNRCSTEEESQRNALEIQAAESREIVLGNGWIPVEQYVESQSGTTIQGRKEYRRLLEDMERDKFEIIVIKSIDRLMRSARDWYIFLDKLTRNHKQLYIYIDRKFYTPQDSLLTGIKAILAEDFSRELSKKIKNAHRRRQEKKTGLNITAPMFGWDKEGKDSFRINEKEAEAYRLAFALVLEGRGFYSLANIMYEKGVRSKNGGRISDVQWRKMLYSPRAHGTVVLHTSEYDFEAKKRVKIPEENWIYVENALPAIVTKRYQEEVLQVIAGRAMKNQRKEEEGISGQGRYALSGKIYCESCGNVYYRRKFISAGKTLLRWKCATAVNQSRTGCDNRNVTEEEIYGGICKQGRAEGFLPKEDEKAIKQEFLHVVQKVICQEKGGLDEIQLKREAERLKKKKRTLLNKLLEGVIENEAYREVDLELTEKIKKIQEQLKSINRKEVEYSNYKVRLLQMEAVLDDKAVDTALAKGLLRSIDKITVCQDGTLSIEFLPTFHKNL